MEFRITLTVAGSNSSHLWPLVNPPGSRLVLGWGVPRPSVSFFSKFGIHGRSPRTQRCREWYITINIGFRWLPRSVSSRSFAADAWTQRSRVLAVKEPRHVYTASTEKAPREKCWPIAAPHGPQVSSEWRPHGLHASGNGLAVRAASQRKR